MTASSSFSPASVGAENGRLGTERGGGESDDGSQGGPQGEGKTGGGEGGTGNPFEGMQGKACGDS